MNRRNLFFAAMTAIAALLQCLPASRCRTSITFLLLVLVTVQGMCWLLNDSSRGNDHSSSNTEPPNKQHDHRPEKPPGPTPQKPTPAENAAKKEKE